MTHIIKKVERDYMQKFKKLMTTKKNRQSAFVLPTVLVLSVVLLTLGLSVFQLSSSIARSLTDQYWQRMSRQAAQGGVSYLSACVDQGLSSSTWPTTITQDNTCLGATIGTFTSLNTNVSDANPSPSRYKSSFTIYKPVTGADGIPKARVVGTVEVLNTAGTSTIKSYTSEIVSIVNGPTRSSSQITLGRKHSCTLSDGQAYCWGSNAVDAYAGGSTNNTILGQIGDGTNNVVTATPVPVVTSGVLNGKRISKIAAGYNHTCALASGKVYCWGQNDQGQLGSGSTSTGSNVPLAVDASSGNLFGKVVTDIAAGWGFTCAIAGTGSSTIGRVYCWGDNGQGQLGNNLATGDSSVPVGPAAGTIAALNATSISAGAGHACVIASNVTNARIHCWGRGAEGELGRNSVAQANLPVAMNPVITGNPTMVSAGYGHTCAVSSGVAYCWGWNGMGQIGNGSSGAGSNFDGSNTSNRLVATAVRANAGDALNQKPVTHISATSEYSTCAVADAEVYCWGANWAGQLGVGDVTYRNLAVKVSTAGQLANKSVTDLSLGYYHVCVIADGQVYCWGHGTQAQLGNQRYYVTEGGEYDSYLPVKSVNSF